MVENKWKTYEEIAIFLLNEFAKEFNLECVEKKQRVNGKKSGTSWEIDGIGFKKGKECFVIIECRRYTTSKQSQEKIGGLAYRIYDAGAEGGIIVSPLGLQSGGVLVANAENIIAVKLTPESTKKNYLISFLNKIMIGISGKDNLVVADSVHIQVLRDGEVVDEKKA